MQSQRKVAADHHVFSRDRCIPMLRSSLCCFHFCLLPVVLWLTSIPLATAQQRPLGYVVSFDESASHYANISLTIPSPRTGSVDLMMPVWTPGSYLIREFARNIDHIAATDTNDLTLPLEKIAKNHWRVVCDPGSDVTVTYRLYCHEMSVRTNWVDSDMAVLNGAATYLTMPEARNRVHRIRFELPTSWGSIATSLQPVAGETNTYDAVSLDELIDSPVLCGTMDLQTFEVDGVAHAIANLGDSSLWDTKQAADDVKKIVEQQHAFWGVVPYPHYKFLNVIAESRGGLEHDNSTLVMTSRWNFRDDDKYRDWLSLISHEFFHTWNVRRLRPVGLSDYNFEAENYTRGLWVAEGITSYYQNVMLVRAGLIDQTDYLKRLSKNIKALQGGPGRNVQSLSDSSFDSWIKYYRPDENSANTRVSYYVKGAVVAFLLDAEIRELTDCARSLDDVMRLLYRRHAGGDGFTDADFGDVVDEVCGADMTDWLARHVHSAEELDYEPALSWFGLQFPSTDDSETDNENDPDAVKNGGAEQTDNSTADESEKDDKPVAWLGVKASGDGGSLSISGVEHGSPAHEAGLNVGDELLAFNGYRASASTWRSQLTQLGIGETVSVLLARRGRIRSINVVIGTKPKQEWSLKKIKDPTEQQESHLQNWLGRDSSHSGTELIQ
jgi:predicted metalloprotease with PDZ domain